LTAHPGESFGPVTVRRYGRTASVQAAALTCLWYGVFGPRPVQIVLVREHAKTGHNLALASTDLTASPAAVIERYAWRWSVEVAVEDAKQVFGTRAGPEPGCRRDVPSPASASRSPGT
jgi:hypothetical protein